MLAEVRAVKQQEEAVRRRPPSSLAAQPLPPGTTASFCPAAADGEEQQGTAIPVLGHGGHGARDQKKAVTQEEGEGDSESVYTDYPRVDLAFHRLLSSPSGFICFNKCNKSRAGPEHCLRMMAYAVQLLAIPLPWF